MLGNTFWKRVGIPLMGPVEGSSYDGGIPGRGAGCLYPFGLGGTRGGSLGGTSIETSFAIDNDYVHNNNTMKLCLTIEFFVNIQAN